MQSRISFLEGLALWTLTTVFLGLLTASEESPEFLVHSIKNRLSEHHDNYLRMKRHGLPFHLNGKKAVLPDLDILVVSNVKRTQIKDKELTNFIMNTFYSYLTAVDDGSSGSHFRKTDLFICHDDVYSYRAATKENEDLSAIVTSLEILGLYDDFENKLRLCLKKYHSQNSVKSRPIKFLLIVKEDVLLPEDIFSELSIVISNYQKTKKKLLKSNSFVIEIWNRKDTTDKRDIYLPCVLFLLFSLITRILYRAYSSVHGRTKKRLLVLLIASGFVYYTLLKYYDKEFSSRFSLMGWKTISRIADENSRLNVLRGMDTQYMITSYTQGVTEDMEEMADAINQL